MRRLMIILIVLVLVSVSANGFAAPERRVALVIGNSAYSDAPLRNPVNDATDMASALRNLGFIVTLKTDANQRAMEESIRAFGNTLRSGGVGLFYYAGHGIQSRGANYLIPVRAEIKSEADVKYEAVDAGRVLAQMEEAGNSLNIIILDACRNNPYAKSFRSSEKGLAKMDAPKGSVLAYATAPGDVAADGSGSNGLYTEKLLKHMQTKGITIERMFKLVRKDVTRGSGETQVPWESSSLIGDFYFNPGEMKSTQPTRAIGVQLKQGTTSLSAEEEMWAVVRTSPVVSDYYKFLDEYPSGRFSGAAKLKIEQLKRAREENPLMASPSPEDKAVVVISKDRNFEKLSNGVVYDKDTDLEWFAGPDRNTTCPMAKKWADSLKVAGGGWRMPTQEEVETLHKEGAGERNMSLLFKNSAWFVCYYEVTGPSSATLGTVNFGLSFWAIRTKSNNQSRAFAVRKRK